MGRKTHGRIIEYEGRRYTWSEKGYWRCTDSKDRHNLTRRLWTDAHGPISKESIVVYKDGNSENVNLDNIDCVSRSEYINNKLKDETYKTLSLCYLVYGHLIRAIKRAIDPESSRRSGLKAWGTRRERYGMSGSRRTDVSL